MRIAWTGPCVPTCRMQTARGRVDCLKGTFAGNRLSRRDVFGLRYFHKLQILSFSPRRASTDASCLRSFYSSSALSSRPTVSLDSRGRPDLNHGLPISCPGCGAFAQESEKDAAGYYTRSRKAVKQYLRAQLHPVVPNDHNLDVKAQQRLSPLSENETSLVQLDTTNIVHETEQPEVQMQVSTPICDRCHDLVYNSRGHSIAHPSVEDLADSIAESTFAKNHVFHVLDAADFPMSVIPKIFQSLELAKPRSQNRRSQHKNSTKPTVSFLITRSDLLGPSREAVDKMMPYFQTTLRQALGSIGKTMRLGNVHLVSAKRGWWTKDIKDNIWERGGGNWMVGKVNVGKSNLFEVLFPKGSGDRAPVYAELKAASDTGTNVKSQNPGQDHALLAEDSLLPPVQPEVPFPTFPVVSSLPGTTASPIRLSFGNHKGELVDLPGLERGSLEDYVQREHRLDLVMQFRPNVHQHIIKPGQSLLLGGGLICITPRLDANDPSMTMLAYPFVPIDAHVTSDEKACAARSQQRESGIKSILADGTGDAISSAGVLKLRTDVTKIRASSLLRAGVPLHRLPFRVYSTDVLVEGVGWVELVCQVRKRRRTSVQNVEEEEHVRTPTYEADQTTTEPDLKADYKPVSRAPHPSATDDEQMDFPFPQIEVFSPRGKHVGQRPPLGAWMLWDTSRKQAARNGDGVRPRKPMAGTKKRMKLERRMQQPTS